jgi:hypothetical protein
MHNLSDFLAPHNNIDGYAQILRHRIGSGTTYWVSEPRLWLMSAAGHRRRYQAYPVVYSIFYSDMPRNACVQSKLKYLAAPLADSALLQMKH